MTDKTRSYNYCHCDPAVGGSFLRKQESRYSAPSFTEGYCSRNTIYENVILSAAKNLCFYSLRHSIFLVRYSIFIIVIPAQPVLSGVEGAGIQFILRSITKNGFFTISVNPYLKFHFAPIFVFYKIRVNLCKSVSKLFINSVNPCPNKN
jgi:hypothetical protein